MPHHTILDPFLVALPAFNSSDEYLRYFQALIIWGTEIRNNTATTSISQSVLFELHGTNRFPTYESVRSIIDRFSLTTISAYDVSQMLTFISGTQPFLEERCGIRAILVDRVTINPEEVLDRLDDRVRSAFSDGCAMVAIGRVRGWAAQPLYLGTSRLPSETELTLTGAILEAESSAGEAIAGCEIATTLEIVDHPNATRQTDLQQLALQPMLAVEHVHNSLPDTERGSLAPLVVGPHFLASMQQYGIQHQMAIIRRLYRIVVYALLDKVSSIAGADLHPVRVSAAADSPQECRGGDKLWRCKLSQHGAGFRLHYWSLAGGGIELDRILVEADV